MIPTFERYNKCLDIGTNNFISRCFKIFIILCCMSYNTLIGLLFALLRYSKMKNKWKMIPFCFVISILSMEIYSFGCDAEILPLSSEAERKFSILSSFPENLCNGKFQMAMPWVELYL